MKIVSRFGVAALGLMLLSCASQPEAPAGPDAQLRTLAVDIAAACPASAAKGAGGRDACSQKLGRLGPLQSAIVANKGILWGGMAKDGDFEPKDSKLTRLDGLVWSKLYLSLFSFPGTYTIETQPNGDKVLLMDVALRDLAPEEFPYPFWHSADKWRAYHQARKVGLVFRNGTLIAGVRAALDTTIPVQDIKWDGKWQWEENGHTVPRASLYEYTLSKGNPERAALEDAYSNFESAARPYNCTSCHNPANPRGINPLIFFTHPAQALAGRHDIVEQLELNKMPPPKGITDEAARAKLIDLAKRFADEGDKALAYEGKQASR
jgi:hypothetical protein